MSIQAVRSVLERSRLRPVARLVLVVIAEHADHTGVSWPGLIRIAQEGGYLRRHSSAPKDDAERARRDRESRNAQRRVSRLVAECSAAGELIVERTPGHPNRYRLALTPPAAPPAAVAGVTHGPNDRGVPPAPVVSPPARMTQTPGPHGVGTTRSRHGSTTTPDAGEVEKLLAAEGVAEVAAVGADVVARYGLDAERTVRTAICERRRTGMSAGWLVHRLRDPAQCAAWLAEAARAPQTMRLARTEPADDTWAHEHHQREELLGTLSEEQAQRVRKTAIERASEEERRRWASADWHTHRSLRVAMYHVLLGERVAKC